MSGQNEGSGVAQGILVEVDGFGHNDDTIYCRYIGCLYLILPQQNQSRVRMCCMGLDVDEQEGISQIVDVEHALGATKEYEHRKGPVARFR